MECATFTKGVERSVSSKNSAELPATASHRIPTVRRRGPLLLRSSVRDAEIPNGREDPLKCIVGYAGDGPQNDAVFSRIKRVLQRDEGTAAAHRPDGCSRDAVFNDLRVGRYRCGSEESHAETRRQLSLVTVSLSSTGMYASGSMPGVSA